MFSKGGISGLVLLCALAATPWLSADEYQPTLLSGWGSQSIQPADTWLGQSPVRLTSNETVAGNDCGCARDAACGCQPQCGCCLGACCACDAGLVAFVEWTNWKVRSKALTFGYLYTETENEMQALSISLPRSDGVRVGLGWRFPSCWDVIWTYAYYYTDVNTGAEVPENVTLQLAIPTAELFLGSKFITVSQLDARVAFKYDVNDLEIGRRFILGDCANVRLFGGFRWAILHQQADASGEMLEYQARVPFSLTHRTRVDAYGLRMGGEGRWQLGGTGISVFGRGAGSVLAGIFDTETSMSIPTGNYAYVYRQQATRALPVLEAAAGVAWSCNNLDVSAGYEMATWFNLASFGTPNEVDNNLLLDGFFVRLAYRY